MPIQTPVRPLRRLFGPFLLAVALALASCSTVRVIPEGSYRLLDNEVVVTNQAAHPGYSASEIVPYIRQKPNTYLIGHWNPFLSVYNWSTGKGNWWDRFVRKIGQEPVIFDPELVDKSRSNMETHLNYLGYYGSQVLDSMAAENKKARIYYEITLGKTYPIREIVYDIRDAGLRELYLRDVTDTLSPGSTRVRRGAVLSEQLLEQESERATALFRENGYYGFTKNYFFFEADTVSVRDSALLTIRIENYTRNEQPKDARPHRKYYIGKVFINPVTDLVRYRASLSRGVDPILDTLPYGNVQLLYDRKLNVRPAVLRNMNRMEPDSLYRESVVNSTYRRFSNLRLFSSVSVMLEESDSNRVDCLIRLVPSKVSGYKLNLEASSNSTGLLGVSPAISYYHRNLFHGGEWFNLSFMGNFQFKVNDPTHSTEFGVSSSISFPNFLFLPDRWFQRMLPRTDFSVGYNYQERPEYTRNIISSSFGYSWNNPSRTMYYTVTPLQLNIVKIFDINANFYHSLKDPFLQDSYKNHFDFGAGFTYYYTTDPAVNPAGNRFYLRLQADVAGNLLSAFNGLMKRDTTGARTIWGSPYSQYARGELTLGYMWKFGKENRHAVAARLNGGLGYAYGNSSSIPFEKLFWAGGANSLRGWQARTVGPGTALRDTTFTIPNQTGDIKLEANLEYRFPLFWLLNGAVFFDAGNVWNLRQTNLSSKPGLSGDAAGDAQFHGYNFLQTLAFNTGAGVRLDLDFVVVRLDLGIKLYDPAQQEWRPPSRWLHRDGYAVQFSIGYPF